PMKKPKQPRSHDHRLRYQRSDERLNLDQIIARLKILPCQDNCASLTIRDIEGVCVQAREVLLSQPTLLQVLPPINLLGDIHGQYEDLLCYFQANGYPPDSNYLLLGDYVDRGKQSIETLTLLLALKARYPDNFFLLRGNHECSGVNHYYGFYDECKRRFTTRLWRTFVDCYNCLPLAATIDSNIFCCHGGLSPTLFNLDQILKIERPLEIPESGLACDILWADPDNRIHGWGPNARGVSYTFGSDVVSAFLHRFGFSLICRGHQCVEDGYEFFSKRELITLFSAPNYCGEFDNAGAMMNVDKDLLCTFQILKPGNSRQSRIKGFSS
ncbi:hypothetical protein KR038_010178, partial [Drosophila bunnanda]